MKNRTLTAALLTCVVSMLFLQGAGAQGVDAQRAIPHLDAARALVKQDPPYAAATQYAQFVELEKKAGRDKQARELIYLLLGLMEEDKKTNGDLYIHLIAEAQLKLGKTEDAMRALERVTKPTGTTRNLQLEVTKQLTARFGLQRGVTYARTAFPEVMRRRDVYCKLCYTLVVKGQADTAREFIDITLDLSEIYAKLDAYRFAAFGLHTVGDNDAAIGFIEDALKQAIDYPVASTRAGMFVELAITYDEIGQAKRGLEMLALAEKAAGEIELDNYQRDGKFEDIAEAYAILGHRERSLYWVGQTKSKRGSTTLYKRLIEIDLLAGNITRAKQLNDERNVYFGNQFEVQAAKAQLERGDATGALARFTKLADGFVPPDWYATAGEAFARKGQHTALAALLPKIKDADDRLTFHLAAAKGYLSE